MVDLADFAIFGALASEDPYSKFRNLSEKAKNLKNIMLRHAIIHAVPDAVRDLLDDGAIYDFRLEVYDEEACPCIDCSGKNATTRELAFRISSDIWHHKLTPIQLRTNITKIQSLFAERVPLTSSEVAAMLCRNPKGAYESLLQKGYDETTIRQITQHERCEWIYNFMTGVHNTITSTIYTEKPTSEELHRFVSEISENDTRESFTYLTGFITRYPAYSQRLFTHACTARSCVAVKNMIRFGIFDCGIENPFEYLIGEPGKFSRHGDDMILISIFVNYGYKANLRSIIKLLEVNELHILHLLANYIDEDVTLETLEPYKEKLLDDMDASGVLIYKIVENMKFKELAIGNMSLED